MVSGGAGRKGSRWRRAQAETMANGEANLTPCALCGRPIDYEFTRHFPRHRLAGTAHHIVGLAQGGDPLDPCNLTPAHRGCNTRESNKIRGRIRMIANRKQVSVSRHETQSDMTGQPTTPAEAACLAQGEANRTPCRICGKPLDYALRPHHHHHRAATVHRITTVIQGGEPLDPNNMAPAHRECAERAQRNPNSRRW